MTTTTRPAKFAGYALFDALRDSGLLPEDARYLDTVVIAAEVGKPCKMTFRYRHTPKAGSPLYSDDTKYVAWKPFFDALKSSGLFPMEDSLCRRIRITAPVEGAVSIVYDCYADTRLVEIVKDGSLRAAVEMSEAVVG